MASSDIPTVQSAPAASDGRATKVQMLNESGFSYGFDIGERIDMATEQDDFRISHGSDESSSI